MRQASEPEARPELSVIVPLFNERECIPLLVKELSAAVRELSAEVLIVDDGSTDGSAGELVALSDFRIVRIPRSGKSAALWRGIREARAETLIMIDADLQEDPRQIPEFVQALADGADMIIGHRQSRSDPWVKKKIPSLIFRLLVVLLFQRNYPDVNCAFRAVRRQTIEPLDWFEGAHRLLPLLVARNGGTVRSIPVSHRPRRCGQAKFDSPLRFYFGLRDLLKLRFGLR